MSLAPAWKGPDAGELVDTAHLGSRGVALEAPQMGNIGIQAAKGVGDVNADGFDDLILRARMLPLGAEHPFAIVLVQGRPGWSGRITVEDALPGTAAYVYVTYSPFAGVDFVRGDANFDERVDLSDTIFTLSFLFLGGATPFCEDACDADDNGAIDISDAIRTLNSLFVGGVILPAPHPGAGSDPTANGLGCLGF